MKLVARLCYEAATVISKMIPVTIKHGYQLWECITMITLATSKL